MNVQHALAFTSHSGKTLAVGRGLFGVSVNNLFYKAGKAKQQQQLAFQPGVQEIKPFGEWSEIAKWPLCRNRGEEQGGQGEEER